MSSKWAEGGGEGQSLGDMSPKKSSFFYALLSRIEKEVPFMSPKLRGVGG